MLRTKGTWEKLGRIIKPNDKFDWMHSHIASPYSVHRDDKNLDIYFTARDHQNRSRIGKAILQVEPKLKIIEISPNPLLKLGSKGTFDENGTSYPCVKKYKDETYLFYTGWTPSVKVPFENHLGIAVLRDTSFERLSIVPILSKTDSDPFSFGSVDIHIQDDHWKMWYTCFTEWKEVNGKLNHFYNIKYASSENGLSWERNNDVAIDFIDENEYAICRPSVLYLSGSYHMFFCSRGNKYKIRYAVSQNGIKWVRNESLELPLSGGDAWDSEEQCYPHVFIHKQHLYMLYAGNDYGSKGIGIARIKLD